MSKTYSIDALRTFIQNACRTLSMSDEDAAILADNLLVANMWGVSSHGVSRFPVYFKRLAAGLVNPNPQVRMTSRYPATVEVDGDNGLGSVVTVQTVKKLMELADQYGVAAAGIRHSNHFGAAGYFCEYAAQRGYITLISTVGPANMSPYGGREPYFSTNPFAIGMPKEGGDPIVLDMATSVVAKGKIREIARKGGVLPEGWAMNSEGVPTTDPQEAINGLVMPMAGYKGSGIALAIEYLSGVLTGSGFGKEVTMQYGDDPTPANVGHSVIVMRQDVFMDAESYEKRMERFCDELHGIQPAKGFDKILLPGEKERERKRETLQNGVEIDEKLLASLLAISQETGVPFEA